MSWAPVAARDVVGILGEAHLSSKSLGRLDMSTLWEFRYVTGNGRFEELDLIVCFGGRGAEVWYAELSIFHFIVRSLQLFGSTFSSVLI